MARRCLLALANDFLHLLANLLEVDAESLECLGSHSLALVNQTEQDVLGADVVVVEKLGLFLGKHDNATGLVSEFLEHLYLQHFGIRDARRR